MFKECLSALICSKRVSNTQEDWEVVCLDSAPSSTKDNSSAPTQVEVFLFGWFHFGFLMLLSLLFVFSF